MADTKISAATAVSSPAGSIEIPCNDGGTSKKITVTQIGTALTATQADQETGTSTALFVTPGRQHFHPSAAKCWLVTPPTGTTPSASYNITSLTDVAGSTVVTIGTDFSSANWVPIITNRGGTTLTLAALGWCSAIAAGSVTLHNIDASATQVIEDPSGHFAFAGFGDHA